jgi:hypothetical protein
MRIEALTAGLTAATVLLSTMIVTGSATAQQCRSGPQCDAIQQRAMPFVQRYSSGVQGSGISAAAMGVYCTNMLVAEVSRVCADEQRRMGQPACAALADQQREAHLQTAREAAATSRAVTIGQWTQQCGWR